MANIFDGFWLPKNLRDEIITDNTPWTVQFRAAGQPASEQDPLAVGARWPRLTPEQWEVVFQYLKFFLVKKNFLFRKDVLLLM